MILLVAGSAVHFALSARDKRDLRDLGVVIDAPIVEIVEVTPVRASPCKSAVYAFRTPYAGEQTGKVDCDRTRELDLKPGKTIAVTYLPDKPWLHRVGRFDDYDELRDVGMGTLTVACGGLLFLALAALLVFVVERLSGRTLR